MKEWWEIGKYHIQKASSRNTAKVHGTDSTTGTTVIDPPTTFWSSFLSSLVGILLMIGSEEIYQKDADPWRKACRQKCWCWWVDYYVKTPPFGGFCTAVVYSTCQSLKEFRI